MQLLKDNILSGDIYTLEIRDIDTFFDNNYPHNFSEVGIDAFLKALKIPTKYFLKQPRVTQIELLVNQKNSMSCDKSLILLKRGELIEFASLYADDIFSDLLDRSPVNSSWLFVEESLSQGYIRYFVHEDKLSEDNYNLGVFVDYPILFSKPMLVNTGFYKINKEDSSLPLVLIVPDTKVRLKFSDLPDTSTNQYFIDMLGEVLSTKLPEVESFLEGVNIDSDTCVDMLLNFEKEKMINKSVSKKIRKYIVKESINITNLLDYVLVADSFVFDLKSHSARLKFQTEILSSLFTRYNKKFDLDYLENYKEGY